MVAVTGAGGFVGSAVVRLAVRRIRSRGALPLPGGVADHVVAVLRPEGSADRLAELPPSPAWSIERADLSAPAPVRDLVRRLRPRAVVHLAAGSARPDDDEEQRRLHVDALAALVEGLAPVPGGLVVNAGSAWVLPAGDRMAESVAPEPRTAYARAKMEAERILPDVAARAGVGWVNLRLFNIFGRYEPERRLLPYVASRLVAGRAAELSVADHVRDWSDVDDIAEAFLCALGAAPGATGCTYHIGSGRGTTIRDFALMVAAVTGNAELIRFGAPDVVGASIPCQVADPSLAVRTLGWRPPPTLEPLVHRTVRWWLGRWHVPAARSRGRGDQ